MPRLWQVPWQLHGPVRSPMAIEKPIELPVELTRKGAIHPSISRSVAHPNGYAASGRSFRP